MDAPFISVVVPCFQQAGVLAATLASLDRQRTSAPFEVVVVDDGSTDDTRIAAGGAHPFALRCERIAHAGRAAARNAGVRAARGDVILFCDADRPAANGFVAAHLRRHAAERPPLIVVGAVLEWYFADADARLAEIRAGAEDDFARFRALAREPAYVRAVTQIFDPDGRTGYAIPWVAFLSGNLSVSRAALERIGGFDERFVDWGLEHLECGYRLHAAGVPFVHEPSARNYHVAHRRDRDFYERGLRSSFSYWAEKHEPASAAMLEAFLYGRISLQQYDAAVAGGARRAGGSPPVYYGQLAAAPRAAGAGNGGRS